MWSIVNYIQALILLVVTMVSGTFVVLFKFISGSSHLGFMVMRYIWSPLSLFFLGINYKVKMRSDLSKYDVCIFYSNHTSWIDIALVNRVIPRNLHFIAKEELKRKPFVGAAIRAMDMIFVDRTNRSKAIQSLNRAALRIKEGRNIIAFPEGTRSRDGQLKVFKKGMFHLAIQSGVPVVPVVISGAYELVPTGFKMRPGKVTICIGEPILTDEMTVDDLKTLMDRSWSAMNEIKSALDEERAA